MGAASCLDQRPESLEPHLGNGCSITWVKQKLSRRARTLPGSYGVSLPQAPSQRVLWRNLPQALCAGSKDKALSETEVSKEEVLEQTSFTLY